MRTFLSTITIATILASCSSILPKPEPKPSPTNSTSESPEDQSYLPVFGLIKLRTWQGYINGGRRYIVQFYSVDTIITALIKIYPAGISPDTLEDKFIVGQELYHCQGEIDRYGLFIPSCGSELPYGIRDELKNLPVE